MHPTKRTKIAKTLENCTSVPSYKARQAQTHSMPRVLCSATKGLGAVAPTDWQDAGEALDNDELKGCSMPKGAAQNVQKDGGYLQYNEVGRFLVLHISQLKGISSTLFTTPHKFASSTY